MLFLMHLRMALRMTRSEGTRAARRGSEVQEQPAAPDRKAKPHPQGSREACGVVFYTPRPRGRGLAKRGGDLGGQQGVPRGHAVPPEPPTCDIEALPKA
jgi:hypothetical protein